MRRISKKIILAISFFVLASTLFTQQESHDVSVINIEVPVRVFKGDTFVDNLTIDDFEVFEDGVPQKIEAVYLVKKTSIEREEGKKKFVPGVLRHFVLFFEITEYLPEIEGAVEYFFNQVIMPGDSLIVVTPLKTYNLKSQSLELKPKDEVVKQLIEIVRRDAIIGGAEYKNAIQELEESLLGAQDLDERLQIYSYYLKKLESLRSVDEKKLLEFSDYLKEKEGQKCVFLFYQKEVIPQISTSTLSEWSSLNQDRQDVLQNISDLFQYFRREISFNVDLIKKAYSNSSISIHFLYLTKTQPGLSITSIRSSGMRMQEQSEDIFSAFREMAQATGGLSDSSADASSAFQRAVDAAENYYLIYYEPQNYKKDGKFREIKVKLKNKNYRIIHRAGYYAE
jgi:VWFA-related protein